MKLVDSFIDNDTVERCLSLISRRAPQMIRMDVNTTERPKATREDITWIKALHRRGMRPKEIAADTGWSVGTVRRHLK